MTEANGIKIIPQVAIGPRGQLQVVVQVPFEQKEWFKEQLQ